MNLPNKLTVSRLILTVFFLAALFIEFRFHFTVALVLFVAASLTDLFDGIIARRRNLITDFGKLMDPLADKVLICSAFIAFIELEWIWLTRADVFSIGDPIPIGVCQFPDAGWSRHIEGSVMPEGALGKHHHGFPPFQNLLAATEGRPVRGTPLHRKPSDNGQEPTCNPVPPQ